MEEKTRYNSKFKEMNFYCSKTRLIIAGVKGSTLVSEETVSQAKVLFSLKPVINTFKTNIILFI